jgi:asparagine N-glycosylation enzyme membrane subunit Stt3
MPSWARRVVALMAGLLLAAGGLWLAVLDPLGLHEYIKNGPPSEAGPDPIYHRFADRYIHASYVGVALVGALALTLLFWERRPRSWVSPLLFTLSLFVALTLSLVNYISGDFFVPRSQQAVIDLILVFMGLVCISMLLRFKVSSVSGRVLKALTIGVLCLEAVAIPGVYALLWTLNAQRLIALGDTQNANPGWISALTSVGSLLVGDATYRRRDNQDNGSARLQANRLVTPS